ncbi:hypothetical protein VTL71DRAFT_13022 [Oculimacula yallundae]|uniref:Uncharacterized protein n=1 Tax=Oculimacula yallundae TaxID=86028 RepID=A0ABR4CPS8_9HELO
MGGHKLCQKSSTVREDEFGKTKQVMLFEMTTWSMSHTFGAVAMTKFPSSDQVAGQDQAAANQKSTTYTLLSRPWPQAPPNSPSSSSSTHFHPNTSLETQPYTSSSPFTSQPDKTKLPSPMDRWLAEFTAESPYNAISSFENSTFEQGQGQRQKKCGKGGEKAVGGEKMERGNGEHKSVGDNWSMERNDGSERWM